MTQPFSPDPLSAARPVPLEGMAGASGLRAYHVQPATFEGLGLSLRATCFGGVPVPGVYVAVDDAALAARLAAFPALLAPVNLPAHPEARARLVATWVRNRSRQTRVGLLPFLLLPLAACGGGGADNAATTEENAPVENMFRLVALLDGLWSIGADHGNVMLTQQGADYVLTPDSGAAVTLAVAATNGLVVPHITLSADAADLDGVPLTGTGAVALFRLEAAPTADLSSIAVTGARTAFVTAGENLAFTGDLGTGFVVTLGAGATLTATAARLSGQVVQGAGTVVVTELHSLPGVDLSGISTTTVEVSLDATGGVVFAAAADLGAANVTIGAATAVAEDTVTFVSGADLTTAQFVVNGTATLVLTDDQVDTVSKKAVITGTGHVRVTAQLSAETAESAEILVRVSLDGTGGVSTLTFDLPADDNDVLVLAPGSSIALNNGTLIVDDGEVDLRNLSDATDFAGVANVRINSGLILTVDQLALVTRVETAGSGRLEIVVEKGSDIDKLAELLADTTRFGPIKPAFSVKVAGEFADAAGLEALLVAAAASLATAADFTVSVNLLDGSRLLSEPDTTGPAPVTILLSAQTISAGQSQALDVTITFTEKVIGFDSNLDVTYDTSLGSLSQMISTDGGQTWSGQFLPAATAQEGSTRFVIAPGSYTDLAGNLGQGGQSEPLVITSFVVVVTPGDLVFADFIDTGVPGDLQSVDNSFTLTTIGGSAGAVPRFELSLDGGVTWTTTIALQNDLEPGIYSFRALVDDGFGSPVPSVAQTVEIMESQLDLIEIARIGDDLSVGVMFKPRFDLEPGLGAFEMVIDLTDSSFAILPGSVVFAEGVTGLANLVAQELIISAFALPAITDFETPLFQFTASRQGSIPQLDIVIENIIIDGTDAGSAMNSFSFPFVLSSGLELG
ncbi:MAG: hypothetical protein IKD58_03785 [Loktanella sp.]|nr:hypothetical protein [Loktanella sp.]